MDRLLFFGPDNNHASMLNSHSTVTATARPEATNPETCLAIRNMQASSGTTPPKERLCDFEPPFRPFPLSTMYCLSLRLCGKSRIRKRHGARGDFGARVFSYLLQGLLISVERLRSCKPVRQHIKLKDKMSFQKPQSSSTLRFTLHMPCVLT